MPTIPKPKGNELIDRLNALDEQARKNELLMEGLRREARALRRSDPSMSYHVEGLIEFAVGNRHKAIVLLDKAIDLDPNRYVIRSNYALHLFNAMDAARAYEQQEHAYRLTEGSPDDARELCKFALFAGRICRAREVLQLLDRLKAGVPDDLRKTVLGASQIQAARGFDDDRAFSFLAKIYGFFLERNLDSHTIVMGAVPDDEDGLITLDIIVNSSLDTVLQLQDELIEFRLGVDEPADLACAFSINVRANV